MIKDYGTLQETERGMSRLKTSILLCKKANKLQLIVRRIGTAPLGTSAQYSKSDATAETVAKLREIVADLEQRIASEPGAD